MRQLFVIKIGGRIIDDPDQLNGFLQQLAQLGGDRILVHGGGDIASNIGKRMGLEPVYVEGRRVTDQATLELVTMVYGGLVNKAIVAQLQSMNIPAIGLTGADANLMLAQKRAVKEVDYGFVGDLTEEGINQQFLSVLLDQQLIPVVAPLTHDGKGQMLNTNADTIAREIAVSMSGRYQVQLIYCFDKHGVLRDPEDEDSVIPQINLEDYERYKAEGVVKAGMIPKLDNAFNAIKHGVGMVRMGQASQLTNLVGGKAGTLIYSS